MDKITLWDLCPIIDKNIFFITDYKKEDGLEITKYLDADDFYENPESDKLLKREVLFITTMNNHLNIILK